MRKLLLITLATCLFGCVTPKARPTLYRPPMVNVAEQDWALPAGATWEDTYKAFMRALARRGLVPLLPHVLERFGILRTPWVEVEYREVWDGPADANGERKKTHIRRLHSLRLVYREDFFTVAIDCAERWPWPPYWQLCPDDQRNLKYAKIFEGVGENIVREVERIVKRRERLGLEQTEPAPDPNPPVPANP